MRRQSLSGTLLPAVVLFLPFLLAAPAAAQTVTVEIPAERDTMLAEAHKPNNYGAWGLLWVKVGNGRTRVLVGVDLSPLAGRAADIVSAKLRLRAASITGSSDGDNYEAHLQDAGAGFDWTEGSGRFDKMSYCDAQQYYAPPLLGTGVGATWSCPNDPNIGSSKTTVCGNPWTGGFPGFVSSPFSTRAIFNREAASCSSSLSCWSATGTLDCWAPLDWDVTADVVASLSAGSVHPSWLLKRAVETGAGGFYAFSRESTCVGLPDRLGPRLVVTLTGAAPVIQPPQPHCETYAP